MTKLIAVAYSAIILGITYFGMLTHSSLLAFLMDLSPTASVIRASTVLIVSLYCFASSLRIFATHIAMKILGTGLILFGLVGMLTPVFYNSLGYYALPLDMFFAINWGAVTLLAALERPLAQNTTFSVVRSVSRAKRAMAS